MSVQDYKSRIVNRRRPFYAAAPKSKTAEKPKSQWVILPVLWKGLKRVAMGIGFLVLFSALISFWTLATLSSAGVGAGMPKNIVLVIPFEDGLADMPKASGFPASFSPPPPSIYQITEAIEAAKKDPRVKALVGTLSEGSFALAHAEEIRTAIKDFRSSGKPAFIYAPSFGEGGGGLGRYYLAAAFTEIWMQPMGVVSIPGINAEAPYLRGVLDEWGIKPQFYQRYEYKTAYESVNETAMTEPNREMLTDMVTRLRTALVKDIAADRNMSEAEFSALVDKALFTGDIARATKLIDRLDYEDVLADTLVHYATGQKPDDVAEKDMPFVYVATYSAELEKKRTNEAEGLVASGKPKVALVYATGAIMQNDQGGGPGMSGDNVATAEALVPAIMEAVDDDDVSAIVLRVDSPGGSPTASESILRALEKAKAKGKQVIVSMGPTAASGGYWIAAKADRIFALPTTITGSIGVLGGKLDVGGLWEKLHVNWDAVRWGENSTIWSFNHSFSPTEAEQVNLMLDNVYDSFLARVAEGRKMDVAAVGRLARGRVWTGAAALEVGLVDELGSLTDALDFVAKQEGLKNRTEMAVAIYPKPLTPLEKLAKLFGAQEQGLKALAAQSRVLEYLAPVLAPVMESLAIAREPAQYGVYEPLKLR